MHQLTLNKSACTLQAKKTVKEPLISGGSVNEAKIIGFAEEITVFQVCLECGHEMPRGVVICWTCGYCMDKHIRELAEGRV